MKILVAVDKFKDALGAQKVGAAIAAGVRAARSHVAVEVCPLADGGEGTGGLLAAACGAHERSAVALDPLGRERRARWWHATSEALGIIEMAAASGIGLLTRGERDALRATTYGTGQLLAAAKKAGCRRILVCVGGSATVDGGAGCLQALGWRLLDEDGSELERPLGGGDLWQVARVRAPDDPFGPALDVLCDVGNPLVGPRGAARVFGPQKGADKDGVAQLERGLTHWADLLARDCGPDVRDLKGAGAAGGLPAGLVAACGARLGPGFDEVARQVGLAGRLDGCDLCVTGEGCLDDQTGEGKTVAGVARLAREAGVPVVALVGAVRAAGGKTAEELARELGLERIVVITPDGMPLAEALQATGSNLQRAAEELVREWG